MRSERLLPPPPMMTLTLIASLMSSGPGLKELKKIIKGIKDEFWNEDIWNKYKDEFTSEKAHKRVIAEFIPFAREMVDKSSIPSRTIEQWAFEDLEDEQLELRRIEGGGVDIADEPLDPWEDDDYEE